MLAEVSALGAGRRAQQSQLAENVERERTLVVDDDPQTLRYVRDVLVKAGYKPIVTADPDDAHRLMEVKRPHLVLLDLMLSGTDGIELMPRLRDIADVPVIFVSAYGRDEIIVRAFEMGAADYVVKPFSTTELAARVKAALRRRDAQRLDLPSEPFVLGDLNISYLERRVTLAGETVPLTVTEYRLLCELSVNAGLVVTHDDLLRGVWGSEHSTDHRLVRGIVKRLRRKLGDDAGDPKYIFTEVRVGYRMARGDGPGAS